MWVASYQSWWQAKQHPSSHLLKVSSHNLVRRRLLVKLEIWILLPLVSFLIDSWKCCQSISHDYHPTSMVSTSMVSHVQVPPQSILYDTVSCPVYVWNYKWSQEFPLWLNDHCGRVQRGSLVTMWGRYLFLPWVCHKLHWPVHQQAHWSFPEWQVHLTTLSCLDGFWHYVQ